MIKTIPTMYIIHIVGMVLCVGKEFYVIQILELFYVEIIIFPVIFDGQTPLGVLSRYSYSTVYENSSRKDWSFRIREELRTIKMKPELSTIEKIYLRI